MAIRYGRGDVKQTTAGFRGPLMVQSLTSAKSKFLSLIFGPTNSGLRRLPAKSWTVNLFVALTEKFFFKFRFRSTLFGNISRLTIVGVLTVASLTGCGGGSSSSGTSLNLTGRWVLNPHSTSVSISFNSFHTTLQQTGNTVTSANVTRSAPPGTVACSSGAVSISGTVAGNIFNGTLTTTASTTTFSVSGASSSLAGTFQTHFHSGPCAYAGIVIGTVTLAKV